MGFDVTPGPLPADGARVAIETDLEVFVQDTEIVGLTHEVFKGGSISFVASQTDTPGQPYRGLMWFKRGKGRLMMFDTAAPLSQPSGDSNTGWVEIGGGRTYLVRANTAFPAGAAIVPCSSQSSANTAIIHDPTTSSSARWPRLGFCMTAEKNKYMLPLLVATDTGTTGAYITAMEVGFTDLLVTTGATSTPSVGLFGEATDPSIGLMGYCKPAAETNPTEANADAYYFSAFVTESSGSNYGLRYGFKKFRPQGYVGVFTQ